MNSDYPHPFIAIAAAVAIALSYFGW